MSNKLNSNKRNLSKVKEKRKEDLRLMCLTHIKSRNDNSLQSPFKTPIFMGFDLEDVAIKTKDIKSNEENNVKILNYDDNVSEDC